MLTSEKGVQARRTSTCPAVHGFVVGVFVYAVSVLLLAQRSHAGAPGSNNVDVSSWVLRGALGTNVFRHSYEVFALQFSPDGKTLMSAGGHKIILWDVPTGARVREFVEPNWITHAAYSGNGKRILSCSGYHAKRKVPVTVWDVDTGRQVFRAEDAHFEDVGRGWISADGKRVLSSGSEEGYRLWNIDSGKVRDLGLPKESSVQWCDPELRRVFTVQRTGDESDGERESQYVMFDIEGGTNHWQFDVGTNKRCIRALSPDQTKAVISHPTDNCVDGHLEIRDATTFGTNLAVRLDEGAAGGASADSGGDCSHRCWGATVFASDGRHLAAARGDSVWIWRADTGEVVRRLHVPGSDAPVVALSPDGEFVSVAADATIGIWRVRTGEQVDLAAANLSDVSSVLPAADSKTVVAGSSAGQIHAWDMESGRLLSRVSAVDRDLDFMAWDTDGSNLWCAGSLFHKIELPGGKILATVGMSTQFFGRVVTMSSDRKKVLVEKDDRCAVYDIGTGKLVPVVTGRSGCDRIDAVFVEEPPGLYVADGGLSLWTSNGLQCTFRGDLPPRLEDRSFSGDGRFLLGSTGRDDEGASGMMLYELPESLSAEKQKKVLALVEQLGSTGFRVREDATKELKAEGWAVAQFLRDRGEPDDPEVAGRVKEVIASATNSGALRLIAELPLRDQAEAIVLDPEAGVWAAFLYSNEILEVTHVMVGTFSARPPRLTFVKEFEVGEKGRTLCLLPEGKGVLCGNMDGTVLWFGPPPAKTK